MAVTYGFYNSSNGDRKYNAEQFGSIFDGVIMDGIFETIGDHFAVTPVEGSLAVYVGTGRAWFNHTWTLNDSNFQVTLEDSNLVLPRIDAIVLETNESTRTNSFKAVTGTAASSPQKPTLTNTQTVHQYALAYVTVSPGAETITQANIENNIGKEDCPFVVGILETIDISSLIAQWESQWDEWLTQQENDFTTFQEYSEASFIAWFETIRGKLGEDPAGELQNQVDDLKAAVTGYPLKFSANTNSLQIIAKRNSIESIGVTGFTKQAGSGDASPENKRAISVATKRMVELILTGAENWTYDGSIFVLPPSVKPAQSRGGDIYSTIYKGVERTGFVGNRVISSSIQNLLILDSSFSDAESFKSHLAELYASGAPLIIWYTPADISKATGIYLPFERTDESGYHCDCIKLSADLCEGDKAETCVKSGCDKTLTIDGSAVAVTASSSNYVVAAADAAAGGNVYAGGLAYLSLTAGQIVIPATSFPASVTSAQTANTWLQSNPQKVWYQSTAYTEKDDVPVQLETHLSAVGKIDAATDPSITNPRQQNQEYYGCLYNGVANLIAIGESASFIADKSAYVGYDKNINGDQFTVASNGIIVYGVKKALVAEAAQAAVTEYMAQNPISFAYPLATPAVYARDPVHIQTRDGATNVSTPEGCILEVSLSKNEAKTFKATFLMDSWKTSGSEYTQEATVKCIDGPSALTENSKWDSPIYTEQTSVLATNEKLIDALTILNMGEILFKDGAISCRVSEKPASDIEILFKAKR